jgi:hypothetical protein
MLPGLALVVMQSGNASVVLVVLRPLTLYITFAFYISVGHFL